MQGKFHDCEIAVYRGEEMLSIGTIPDVVAETGLLEKTIRWMLSPSGQRRAKRRNTTGLRVVILEDEE
jgi:hypothetical protein